MIQIDRELQDKINGLHSEIHDLNKEIRFLQIISNVHFILGFIVYIFISIGMTKILKKHIFLLSLLNLILFMLLILMEEKDSKYKNEAINNLQNRTHEIEDEIEDTEKFISYLISYRKIEALSKNMIIYPEIYLCDAEHSVKNDKGRYENRRIEYEKQHIERLKLNKHYLIEKINSAPIETYPISEQLILQQYLKETKGEMK